jgi:diketogulonate reductase-like aldo/keto reductase
MTPPESQQPADHAATTSPGGLASLEAAGVRIPRIGLGTFNIPPDDTAELVRSALEAGYRHVDTAMMYRNEPGVGQGVRDSSVPRDEVFVTTKFPHAMAAAGQVPDAAWSSVRALGLGHIDLLLMHWPNADVPVEETFGALVPLVADGVIRSVGLSNAPAGLVRRALAVTPLAAIQVEHHPYLPQETLYRLAAAEGIALTAYAPFAEGRVFSDPVLNEIGAKHGKTAGQVTLRWLLRRPQTAVIPKTARPERLPVNLDVFDFELDEHDVERINALGASRQRFFDPPWYRFTWDQQ